MFCGTVHVVAVTSPCTWVMLPNTLSTNELMLTDPGPLLFDLNPKK
jgi:hypothetical protein